MYNKYSYAAHQNEYYAECDISFGSSLFIKVPVSWCLV